MIYFSDLQGKKVYSQDKVKIGRLQDLIFQASQRPLIKKILIYTPGGERFIVPIRFLKKINREIIIDSQYITEVLEEDELFLGKNLLDKQIIDIKGHKIVRVNDVIIADKPQFSISGVDIGFLGIMRRLHLEKGLIKIGGLFHVKTQPADFLSWSEIQPLELARGRVRLKKEEEKLKKLKPEDLADYLEKTNIVSVRKILDVLDEDFAAEVIGNLNINFQANLFSSFNNDKAAKVLSLIDPDEAVDILLTFKIKKREQIIGLLADQKKREINHLLSFAKTPIGDLITSEYLSVNPSIQASEVLEKIKQETGDFSLLEYVYVTNNNHQLVGVFNLHELLLQDKQTPVYKFMISDVVVIHLTTPEEIAVKKMIKYKINALPVIDKEKQIIGIVTIDDLSHFLCNIIS